MKIREGFVESEGHKLAYLSINEHLDNQNEPALIFIHGALASINSWHDAVPEVYKENKSWYSLSLPAHHPSVVPNDFDGKQVSAEWFYTVMSKAINELIGERKFLIVGHSTGGFVGLNLAMNHFQNLLGVISIGGFHSGNWSSAEGLLVKMAGLGKFTKGLFILNLSLSKIKLVQLIFTATLTHKTIKYLSNPLGLKFANNIRPDLLKNDSNALFTLFSGIGSIDIKNQLPNIKIPCYIFAGIQDPVILAEQTLVLIKQIPQAKTVLFDEVGHMIFAEAQNEFNDALNQSINEILNQNKL